MKNLIHTISTIDAEHIERILTAALERYRELFPDWEIIIFSLERTDSREDQIDRLIHLLQKIRNED